MKIGVIGVLWGFFISLSAWAAPGLPSEQQVLQHLNEVTAQYLDQRSGGDALFSQEELEQLREWISALKIQESIWLVNEKSNRLKDVQFSFELQRILSWLLRNGEVKSVEGLNSGKSESYQVKFANGLKASFKPDGRGQFYRYEIASYWVDQLHRLNLMPLTLERSLQGKVGVLQYWVKDSQQAFQVPGTRPSAKVRALDYLINNDDRANVNYLLMDWFGFKRQVAIDHNSTFDLGERWVNVPQLENALDPVSLQAFVQGNPDVIREKLKPWISRSQIHELLARRKVALDRLTLAEDFARLDYSPTYFWETQEVEVANPGSAQVQSPVIELPDMAEGGRSYQVRVALERGDSFRIQKLRQEGRKWVVASTFVRRGVPSLLESLESMPGIRVQAGWRERIVTLFQ